MGYFPKFKRVKLEVGKTVNTDEYMGLTQTFILSIQHVVAMFGATILAPIIMGFDPNVSVLMSGIGTLIFFFLVGGRLPSYLGSSFSFIAGVTAITAGSNGNIPLALGAILVCGLVYALIGVFVAVAHERAMAIIKFTMPPVVTGAVVAVIGLNLASIAVMNSSAGPKTTTFDAVMAIVTILCVSFVAVYCRGMAQRLLILLGLIASCVIYYICANVIGIEGVAPLSFDVINQAAWFGAPKFTAPAFEASAIILLLPLVVVLVVENLGHVRAVSEITGKNMDKYLGRAFIGDGVATMLAGSVGGTGLTTYAENIGVMAANKIYSTLVFVFAGVIAILLGFSPKFGAIIHIIPAAVLSGMEIVVFGLIAVTGARIWIENRVDFGIPKNLIIASVTLILGAGNFSILINDFKLEGIGTATFAAIILNVILRNQKNI